jgi:hypothetical protein
MKNFVKNISLPSFFIGGLVGFVLGVLVLGIVVTYLVNQALSLGSVNGLPLSGAIEQVRAGIAHDIQEQQATSVFGKVVSNESGQITLSVYRQNVEQTLTFTYDDTTTFTRLANDDASSELPLSSDTIEAGDRLTISVKEPVDSVPNQHAIKVVKM